MTNKVPVKQFKQEVKKTLKIENESLREQTLEKLMINLLKEHDYKESRIKKMLPSVMKQAHTCLNKLKKRQISKETKKDTEENKKESQLKKVKDTTQEKPKKKKRKIVEKTTEEEKEAEEQLNPKFLRFITGKINEKFLIENHLNTKRVLQFVDALQQLHNSEESSKKKLFSDGENIFLHVNCIKIPMTPTRQLRLTLPNIDLSPGDNVLMFVRDEIKGPKNTEKSEEHYRNLLEEHNIKLVKEVMSLTRVKAEYGQYELKRKLLNSYETFLVDGRISGHLAHFLGKIFMKKRKLPTPIKMDAKDLKYEFEKALRKTIMTLHSTGDSYSIRVGKTSMNRKAIMENVRAICTQLRDHFPGGWKNIRSVRIKTSLSLSLPIYVSLKSKNKVPTPMIKPLRPRAYQDVEGELTTLTAHKNVIVSPEGDVRIVLNKKRKYEADD